MSAPVPFSDIGKPVSDLLGKDFPIGCAKLEINTLAANGVKFTVNGSKDNKTGFIAGEIKAKHVDKVKGLTLTESWTTSNVLNTQVELQDSIAKGLKLDLNASFLPAVGSKNVKFGAEYKQDFLFTRTSLDLFKGPTLSGDAVIGSEGILAGGEIGYDVADGRVTKYNAALGYTALDYSIALHANNALNTFGVSYFHRVNKDVETGAKALWDRKTDSAVSVEVGTKYALDRDAFVKAKIDNTGRLGLGYTQVLRPGVKVSFAGIFDTTRLNENAHKLGLSLVLDG